jgi:hypothetical protein
VLKRPPDNFRRLAIYGKVIGCVSASGLYILAGYFMPSTTGILPLDSPRWKSLSTCSGAPEDVPQQIALWAASIGGPKERPEWTNLSNLFLPECRQCMITNAAYAAVPHIVRALNGVALKQRLDYLADVVLIEDDRQQPESPELPQDLAEAYHAAIHQARPLAIECLSCEWEKIEFRYLLSIVASLHGHGFLGSVLFDLDSLSGECPKCGETVYPDTLEKSGYV